MTKICRVGHFLINPIFFSLNPKPSVYVVRHTYINEGRTQYIDKIKFAACTQ